MTEGPDRVADRIISEFPEIEFSFMTDSIGIELNEVNIEAYIDRFERTEIEYMFVYEYLTKTNEVHGDDTGAVHELLDAFSQIHAANRRIFDSKIDRLTDNARRIYEGRAERFTGGIGDLKSEAESTASRIVTRYTSGTFIDTANRVIESAREVLKRVAAAADRAVGAVGVVSVGGPAAAPDAAANPAVTEIDRLLAAAARINSIPPILTADNSDFADIMIELAEHFSSTAMGIFVGPQIKAILTEAQITVLTMIHTNRDILKEVILHCLTTAVTQADTERVRLYLTNPSTETFVPVVNIILAHKFHEESIKNSPVLSYLMALVNRSAQYLSARATFQKEEIKKVRQAGAERDGKYEECGDKMRSVSARLNISLRKYAKSVLYTLGFTVDDRATNKLFVDASNAGSDVFYSRVREESANSRLQLHPGGEDDARTAKVDALREAVVAAAAANMARVQISPKASAFVTRIGTDLFATAQADYVNATSNPTNHSVVEQAAISGAHVAYIRAMMGSRDDIDRSIAASSAAIVCAKTRLGAAKERSLYLCDQFLTNARDNNRALVCRYFAVRTAILATAVDTAAGVDLANVDALYAAVTGATRADNIRVAFNSVHDNIGPRNKRMLCFFAGALGLPEDIKRIDMDGIDAFLEDRDKLGALQAAAGAAEAAAAGAADAAAGAAEAAAGAAAGAADADAAAGVADADAAAAAAAAAARDAAARDADAAAEAKHPDGPYARMDAQAKEHGKQGKIVRAVNAHFLAAEAMDRKYRDILMVDASVSESIEPARKMHVSALLLHLYADYIDLEIRRLELEANKVGIFIKKRDDIAVGVATNVGIRDKAAGLGLYIEESSVDFKTSNIQPIVVNKNFATYRYNELVKKIFAYLGYTADNMAPHHKDLDTNGHSREFLDLEIVDYQTGDETEFTRNDAMRLFFIMNNKGERRFDDGGDAHVMELVNDVRHVFGEAADVGAVAGIDMVKAMAIRSQDPTADDTMGLKMPLDASLNARLGFLGMMRGARAAVRLAAA